MASSFNHRKTPNGSGNYSNGYSTPTGQSSSYDYDHDQTQANTLANRRASIDQPTLSKQRPVTAYSSLIPPPSPTYFRLQEMAAHRQSQLPPANPQLSRPGELDHLRQLPSMTKGDKDGADAEETSSWHQQLSIWMINE
ncbi:hypothetical protein BGZ94_010306, partial [Podila epigama]